MSNTNAQQDDDNLEEESYYSEEEVSESDSDFEFAELEKEIYNRRGGPPPQVLAAMGKNASTFTPKAAPAPAAPPAPAARPPHPLFGGGGSDGGRNALLDQIKARGATPPAAEGGSGGSGKGPAPKAPAPVAPPAPRPVPPPAPKPVAQLSMAEQVALMAAKRQERLQADSNEKGSDENVAPTPEPANTVVAAPPAPVMAAASKSEPVKKEETKAKGGGFFGGKKDKKETNNKVVTKAAPAAVPAPVAAAPEPATVIKSYKPEPLPLPAKAAPAYSQARLKPTGIREDSPAAQLEEDTAPQQPEAAPLPITTSTTTTTTTTKTKRVTKSTPEYDVTEYKVGCACTVM
jgi:hypothetical protein